MLYIWLLYVFTGMHIVTCLGSRIATDSTGKQQSIISPSGLLYSNNYGKDFGIALNPNNGVSSIARDGSGKYQIVSGYSSLYRSTNYGQSWKQLQQQCLRYCQVASDNTGSYLATSNGTVIYTSTNAGESWIIRHSPIPSNVSVGLFNIISNQKLIVYTSYSGSINSGIWASYDFGISWTRLFTSGTNAYVSAFSGDALLRYLFVQLSTGQLYRSSDGGVSWNVVLTVPFTSSWIGTAIMSIGITGQYGILFVDGYMGSSPNSTQYSTRTYASMDYGQSWIYQPLQYECNDVYIVGTTQTVICGQLYVNQQSNNLGGTWLTSDQCFPGAGFTTDNQCSSCEGKTYGSGYNMKYCKTCPIGYLPNLYGVSYGSWECVNTCSYPYLNIFNCDGVWLNASVGIIAMVVLVHVLSYVGAAIVVARKMQWRLNSSSWKSLPWIFTLELLVTTTLPFLDVLSDLLFLITAEFYHVSLFAMCWVLYLHPLMYIIYDMWKRGYLPYFHLCHIPNGIWNLFKKIDNLGKLLLMTVLCAPFFIFNLVWMIPMMGIAFFLHSTRLNCVVDLNNTWFYYWTGSNEWGADSNKCLLDVDEFNLMTVRETFLESAPQLILQTINMVYMEQTTPVGLFSVILSGISILNAIYKYFYYCCILKYELHAVPNVLQEINMKQFQMTDQSVNEENTENCESGVAMTVFSDSNTGKHDNDGKVVLNPMNIEVFAALKDLKDWKLASQERFDALEGKMDEILSLLAKKNSEL